MDNQEEFAGAANHTADDNGTDWNNVHVRLFMSRDQTRACFYVENGKQYDLFLTDDLVDHFLDSLIEKLGVNEVDYDLSDPCKVINLMRASGPKASTFRTSFSRLLHSWISDRQGCSLKITRTEAELRGCVDWYPVLS